VFINLFVNAARAMQGAGAITITARTHEGAASPGEIEIIVEDSGPGIAEQDLPRLFDPFFTTGEGTGLGLSISFSIVSAHGGSIAAANRPGGGACFTLRFPAVQTAAVHPPIQTSGTP
jgi:signal transduction histidine kinase